MVSSLGAFRTRPVRGKGRAHLSFVFPVPTTNLFQPAMRTPGVMKEVAMSTLPVHPDLEQQKKQAREILRAAREHDPSALRLFREHHPRLLGRSDEEIAATPLALHDAQLVLARDYGFPSWAKLKHEIEARRASRLTRAFVGDLAFYDDRAAGLVSAREAGVPEALAQIREWHPEFAEASEERLRAAPFDLPAARLVYARQHGFESWPAFARYVHALAAGRKREPFLDAFEAMKSRRWDRLASILRDDPALVRARGTNGNTLLNLAASLAASTREPLPPQASQILDSMLASSGAVDVANDRGWTPLHQAAYSNQVALAVRFVEAGAAVGRTAHGEGGTPLAVALFWGHREVAEVLAAVEVVPQNLRVAAGLGRLDLVRACFDSGGTLTPTSRAGRGFYRPHSGFPLWHPSEDSQQILDEALVWASKSDQVAVMPELVARGADVDADPYRGTPLIWAAANGRLAAARWLLDHGADVNRVATFGGPAHGEGVTALHLAAQGDHAEMVEFLLEHGADPRLEDVLYHGTPSGWADHSGATRVRDRLREATGS